MAKKPAMVIKRQGKSAGSIAREKAASAADLDRDMVGAMVDSLTGTGADDDAGGPPDEWYKAIQQLYDGKNLHFITELSENDIRMLIRMQEYYYFCDKKLAIVKRIMVWFMRLRVSKLRKGRLELVDTFRQKFQELREERGFMSRLMGRGGPTGGQRNGF